MDRIRINLSLSDTEKAILKEISEKSGLTPTGVATLFVRKSIESYTHDKDNFRIFEH